MAVVVVGGVDVVLCGCGGCSCSSGMIEVVLFDCGGRWYGNVVVMIVW